MDPGAVEAPHTVTGRGSHPGARFADFRDQGSLDFGRWQEGSAMEVLYPRCAGLDVHKDVVMACARSVVGTSARHDIAEFSTTTAGLLALADWLKEHHSTHVAMEATGVYWKPVWHVL